MGLAKRRQPRICLGLLSLLVPALLASTVSGQALAPQSASTNTGRIDHLEQVVGDLQSEIQFLRQQLASRPGANTMPAPATRMVADTAISSAAYPTHYLTYDDGWTIRPHDSVQSPFELKFNVHNQFRYTGFANRVDSFVDAAGNIRPVSARNDFDINRGRFVFSGYAFNPNIQFYTNLDYNTVSERPVQLLLSWFSYRIHDALTVSMGLGKVPGTWEWYETSRFTLGAERTMATTFFRPSITAGVWAQGQLSDRLHYHVLVGDGFNTFTLQAAELDTNLAYSALVWWEPFEPFGPGFSDLEYHENLSVRTGHGFTYAANDSDPLGEPGPEQTVIRLSDGTRLVENGALAPNVTVNEFDISLYAVHLGAKRRGWSFAAEYFFRWLTSIRGNGALPVNSLFDHGFFAQSGMFLVPERLEAYASGSYVTGDFGTGYEYGGGLNWYCGGRRGSRFTFDVARIEDSPAQQDRTGLVAGGSGTLFRLQWWHFF